MNPHYISRGRKSGKATAINFIPQPLFNFLHKRPTFAFAGESGYTPGFRRKIAHSGSHAETGAFRMGGWYHYPRSVPHVHKHPRAGCQNGVLCRFGILAGRCSRRTQKAFGTAMRLCASLLRGVAAPLGCVIFSLLSKLRPVRPIPETSFSSPDAPACAVPVQATSQLVSFRLEADRGFSVLSLCLTSFFDFGDKKRPPTLCAHGAGQRSDFQYSGC